MGSRWRRVRRDARDAHPRQSHPLDAVEHSREAQARRAV